MLVRFHLRHFEAWAILFTPLCLCLSEETLKADGPNSCVSSRLGCLGNNYLSLEKLLESAAIVYDPLHSCQSVRLLHVLQGSGCVPYVTSHNWCKSNACISRHFLSFAFLYFCEVANLKALFMLYAPIQYIIYLAMPSFESASLICH